MKKKKFFLCIILSLALLGGLMFNYVTLVNAEPKKTSSNEMIENYGTRRMEVCLECSSIMRMQLMCLPDSRLHEGTWTHKCGFLWKDTCTVKAYTAWAGDYCNVCGNFIQSLDPEQSDGKARHLCLEMHDTCGAGNNGYYLVCPCEIKY